MQADPRLADPAFLRLMALRRRLRQERDTATLDEAQASDPLRTWTPLPKQRAFIDAVLQPGVSGTWENWLCGANRIGKTSSGAFCGAMLARFGADPERTAYSALPDGTSVDVRDRATAGWVFGLDSNLLRDIVQPTYFDNRFVRPGANRPFIPDREIQDWRPSDQILRLRSGSMIGFKSCEAPATKVTGSGLDWIHFDEPPPQRHYEEATIRVAGGRRLRIFGTATILPPEGHIETISWLYSTIIAPILARTKTDVGLFTASIYDNPYLDAEEIQRLEARYPVGSLARRIRLNGELLPGVIGAIAYGNFDRAIHVRPQGPPSPYRPLCWLVDFNVSPFCTLVGQYEPGLLRVQREIVLDEGGIETICEEFRRLYPSHPQEIWIYGDATGGNRSSQTAKSSYTLMLQALQNYGSRVRLKVPEANPLEVDRVNAVNLALRDEFGATHLVIDPSCLELIADFEQVLVDPRGGIKKTYNQRDAYHRRTHLSDAAGYFCAYEMPVKPQRVPGTSRALPLPGYGHTTMPQAGYGGRR